MKLRPLLASLAVAAFAAFTSVSAAPLARHVVLIGVDGLSPRGILETETPHLRALAQRGAHTWHARAVMPTSSSPNWASMIMGAGPEQHQGDATAERHRVDVTRGGCRPMRRWRGR